MESKINSISNFAMFVLAGFLIYMFFQDYNYSFLIAALLLPLIVLFTTTKYCLGVIGNLIFLVLGIIGYFYLEGANSLISACLAGFAIIGFGVRYGIDFRFKQGAILLIQEKDRELLQWLFLSNWYSENRTLAPDEITPESLIKEPGYNEFLTPIIEAFVTNNFAAYQKSGFSAKDLVRLHAVGIIYTLPIPVSKNPEGIISTGTQLLLNVFTNIEMLSKHPSLGINNDFRNGMTAQQLVQRSKEIYGPVSETELNALGYDG